VRASLPKGLIQINGCVRAAVARCAQANPRRRPEFGDTGGPGSHSAADLRHLRSLTHLPGGRLLEIKRTVLLPYSVENMFDLIEQAEAYPQFLPWCTAATILERSDEWVAARIEFSYLKVQFGFQTRNPKRRPEWLQVRLVEGPFRRFQADWHLLRLGDQGCKISFDLSYEIAEGMLDKIAVPAVEFVSRSMMDAFVKRAENTLTVAAPALLANAAAPTPHAVEPPAPPFQSRPS
jgi:ribosome-associated toxin RatA of RatAB toxin-antitoxin module